MLIASLTLLRQPLACVRANLLAKWQTLARVAGDPYRPERHYMRGPGPKCLAKQVAAPSRPKPPR